jgi:hypothetical protein
MFKLWKNKLVLAALNIIKPPIDMIKYDTQNILPSLYASIVLVFFISRNGRVLEYG